MTAENSNDRREKESGAIKDHSSTRVASKELSCYPPLGFKGSDLLVGTMVNKLDLYTVTPRSVCKQIHRTVLLRSYDPQWHWQREKLSFFLTKSSAKTVLQHGLYWLVPEEATTDNSCWLCPR
jgi:hypothetical protein